MVIRQQITAARSFIEWTQEDLALKANLPLSTIQKIERGVSENPRASTIDAIRAAFEKHGIEFIEGGVRERQDTVRVLQGSDCYLQLLDDVFITLRPEGGELLIMMADDAVSSSLVNERYRQMRQAGITMRQIIEDKNTYIMGSLTEYRYVPKRFFINNVTLIYDDKVASVVQGEKKITIIRDQELSDMMRNLFEFVWQHTLQPTLSEAQERFE